MYILRLAKDYIKLINIFKWALDDGKGNLNIKI